MIFTGSCFAICLKMVICIVVLGFIGYLGTENKNPSAIRHYDDAVSMLLELGFYDAERRVKAACKLHKNGSLDEIVNAAIRFQ